MTPFFPAQSGEFTFSTFLPVELSGRTLYSQAVELFSAGGGTLTDAVALPIL